jgi:hypothetical protein
MHVQRADMQVLFRELHIRVEWGRRAYRARRHCGDDLYPAGLVQALTTEY